MPAALNRLRTTVQSPWQNGIAERWVGSVRRELTDHIIPLNEQHLRRLGREYLAYYHEDRTHLALEKTTPTCRAIERVGIGPHEIRSLPRVGGLHHRLPLDETCLNRANHDRQSGYRGRQD